MTRDEKTAYEAGKTAEQRIGNHVMSHDPIMRSLIRRVLREDKDAIISPLLIAWYKGRGWIIPQND